MSGHRPPRWLERLLEWALPKGLSGQSALGDLAEDFERRALKSPLRARLWYTGQAVSVVLYRVFTGSGADSAEGSSDLRMDLRWSARSILRHPGFSVGVIVVLGLGLGANASVLTVVDGTLENSTWWAEPDRTVAVWPDRQFSYGQLEMYQYENTVYRSLGGYVELAFALETPDRTSESIVGVLITPELFRELAAQPVLGRALVDDDGVLGMERVVVIGESLWRRSFGADPAILGRQIQVGGAAATVVGVQPAGAMAPGGRSELWLPLVMDPRDDEFWKAQSLTLVGTLRPGAMLPDAQADLMTFTERLSFLFPMFYPEGWADGIADVTRADEAQRRLIRTPLLLLLAGTGLLLLVTALNVGNLLLGRAINRRQELAVRASLGARRGRIVRQLLVEGLVLSALALSLGLLSGESGGRWIAGLFVEEAIVTQSSITSGWVLVFMILAAGVSWLVLSGVPIAHFLRSARGSLNVGRATGSGMQRALVTMQAALATLLLVSATLLANTVGNLREVPLGFDPDGLITVELSPPEDRVESIPVARELYARLIERVEALPGVQSAGLTGWLPLRAEAPETPINLESAPVEPQEANWAPMQMVDPGFFQVMQIEASEGRLLGTEDRSGEAPSAVVVNETLARQIWPDGMAVGQLIAIDPHAWNTWVPVVGVVPDIRSGGMTGPIGPALYVALSESPSRDVTLVVRTSNATPELLGSIQQVVHEVDPLVPVRTVAGMPDVVRAAYATSWVMMGLLLILAGLATGLGAIGIYAVLAQHVAANKREIGVRMALGAEPGLVVGGVVRSGLLLALVGIAIGSAGALLTNRFLESLLYQVSPASPGAFLVPAVILGTAAALAAWIPATRASRLPPAEVLRSE